MSAKDGYHVVLSGDELDPNFGNAPMLLAWEQDGAPLSAEDGPLRLAVPGDPGRSFSSGGGAVRRIPDRSPRTGYPSRGRVSARTRRRVYAEQ